MIRQGHLAPMGVKPMATTESCLLKIFTMVLHLLAFVTKCFCEAAVANSFKIFDMISLSEDHY